MEQFIDNIFNEDCLQFLDRLPDESVDLVVTDPPYGDGIGYGRNDKEILNNEDETINYKVLPKLYRVLKNDKCCYLFTNWKFENKLRDFIQKETKFNIRMMIIIVKNNIGMGHGFRNQYECCLVLEKGNPKYNLNNFSNVLSMEHIDTNIDSHPHQKGFSVIGKILRHSSNENDIVLDCFLGSGTTALVCKKLHRHFIGVELDKKYYDMCINRLNALSSKKSLF